MKISTNGVNNNEKLALRTHGGAVYAALLLKMLCANYVTYSSLLILPKKINLQLLKLGKLTEKIKLGNMIYNFIIYSPQDIAIIIENLIGSLLEAYKAMYHYYLIWEAR